MARKEEEEEEDENTKLRKLVVSFLGETHRFLLFVSLRCIFRPEATKLWVYLDLNRVWTQIKV